MNAQYEIIGAKNRTQVKTLCIGVQGYDVLTRNTPRLEVIAPSAGLRLRSAHALASNQNHIIRKTRRKKNTFIRIE